MKALKTLHTAALTLLSCAVISSTFSAQSTELSSKKLFGSIRTELTHYEHEIPGQCFPMMLWATVTTYGVASIPVAMTNICNKYVKVVEPVTPEANLNLSFWAKDRISGHLYLEKHDECEGFSLNFIGEGDGFGGFKIYKDQEEYSKNQSMGKLSVYGKETNIEFTNIQEIATRDEDGRVCKWSLSENSSLLFNEEKPVEAYNNSISDLENEELFGE